MKYHFSFILFLLLNTFGFSQNWLNISTTGPNWINCGDLDVPGNQLTVEALITMTGGSPGENIVSKHTNPADVNYLLRPGDFEITTSNGFFSVTSSIPITLNKMFHVAATYDGSFIRYYVNGCLTGQTACTGNMFQNNLLTAIGNQSACQCEPFTGYIDEVRIWNVARTSAQLQANMNTLPSPGTQLGLMAYYDMNAGYTNLQGNATWNGTPIGTPFMSTNPFDTTPLQVFNSLPTVIDVDCNGAPNGSIQTATAGGNLNYQYSLNGGANQASNIFSNLGAGSYTVTVTSADNNCIQQIPVTIAQPLPLAINIVSQTNVSCFGGNDGALTLGATGGTNPGTYSWTPNVSVTNTASNLTAGSYTVTLTDNACHSSGVELVTNGDFSGGNVGFASSYAYTPPPNSAAAQYWVGTGPQTGGWNPGMFSNGDHTSGIGNYMLVNGSGTAGTSVWCETIPVTANTNYNFSSWLSSLNNVNPAQLQFSINGVPLGAIFTAPATFGSWQQFSSAWNSGAAVSANICIINQNISLGGNDFGLDDISFQACVKQCSTTTVITITEPPVLTNTLTANGATICAGNNSVLTNVITGGTTPYTTTWSSGGNSIGTPVTTTVTPASTTTYTAVVADAKGCPNTATAIVNVNPLPIPVANSNSPVCVNQTINLNGAGALTYTWAGPAAYSSTTQSPSIINATVAMSGSYTLTVTDNNGCTNSTTTPVTVNPLPTVTVNSATICAGQQTATLTANGANTYSWSPATGLSATVGTSVNATPNVTTNYTVTGTDVNNCVSIATGSVLVNTIPNVTVNSGFICNGASLTLNANGATSYTWGPTAGLSATSGNSVTANPSTTTIYTITGTNANSCTNTATSTVTVINNPTITVNNASICIGQQTATLTASGATTYVWTPGTGLSSTLGASVNANPVVTTSYTITGTTGTCTAVTTCTVSVNTLPTITATSTVICNTASATLNANGATTYIWSTMATGSSITVSPNTTTTYSVAGTDANGCINFTTATVTVNPLPNVTVNSAAICAGGSVILTANNAVICTWAPNTGLSTTIGNSVSANPNVTTQYTVTGTDANGCVNSALSTLTVHPLPNVNTNSATICKGSNTTLTATGANTYNWNPGTGLSNSTSANPTASPNATTSYTVTGTDLNNCQDTATATVTVNPLPLVSVNPPNSSGCAPVCVNFSNTGTTSANATYNWNFGNGTLSTSQAVQSCYASAGTYTATLLVTDSNGCKNTSTAIVTAFPVPSANFSFSPQSTTIFNPIIQFYDLTTGAVINNWSWYFGDGDSSNTQNPLHTYADTGLYYPHLGVISDHGCWSIFWNVLYISPEFLIYVPNAFTPNGDNDNEIFLPKGEGITEYTLRIYDRWGMEIFKSKDINIGWNGKLNNEFLMQDVYVWNIELTTIKGEPKHFSGVVSLLK